MNSELVKISGSLATIQSKGKEQISKEFDTIISAVGHKSYDPLSDELQRNGMDYVKIGDAEKPARIFDAVMAGHQAAMQI